MQDDKDILEGVLKNERKAQELLYNKYASLLLGLLMRYTHNRTEAEDMLQDSFVKIFTHIDQYRGESSLYTWMKRVAINTALRFLETRHNLRYHVEIDQDMQIAAAPHNSEADLTAEEMLKAIRSLPVGFRTIFNLYAVEGYKHKEIAKMLNITESTSKSQYARAKKYIQKILYKSTDIPDVIYMVIF